MDKKIWGRSTPQSEQARFRKAIQEGIAAADKAEFASDEDVRSVFAKWGVDITPGDSMSN